MLHGPGRPRPEIAAGRHRVELRFVPRGLREGTLGAVIGVLGLALALLALPVRPRPVPP